ncbi:immunoglobulin superfamily DCC subclass member 3-like [Ruditapes philippinarum]|uniref:immunoglobulin superfamily DCC subclass member 3-like n=1 Tax=Ruditapes philippinarum TaxID=129788 RepID=UPI00295C2BCF|nr:immunoglobulin superfamily DCC subclass member 3-like [Ruditapes philippinarum]
MFARWSYMTKVVIILNSVTNVIQGIRFTTEPSDQVAALVQSLLWNCEATDDTNVVTYRWTFNSAKLPLHENHVIYSNGSLFIRKVTYNDVGLYVCSASAGGTTVSSRAANLNIAYINPTFSVQPVSQTAILGDNVILSCYIESLPPADVQWTLDGESVTRGEISQNSSGASTLTLYPVMYYHVGTYKCVGSNPLTGVYRYSNDGRLVVQGQPVFLSSLASVSVPVGFQAKFICYFHGNPEPKVTWFMHRATNDDVISKEIMVLFFRFGCCCHLLALNFNILS